ncbi:MAG: hypothetical protein NTX03_09185 [Bacteroidetes bacterium]|nr:hypothetical protein [Bacteroidota bacterium]
MKLSIQYLNNAQGQTQAVQIPFNEWEKIIHTINKYEQLFKIKSDLKQAFSEVDKMKKGKIEKQSLSDFINEI